MLREGILNPSYFETDDGNGCSRPGIGSWARKTLHKVLNKGIPIGISDSIRAHFRCLYTVKQNMRNNKQMCTYLQGYDVIGIIVVT